jgi:phosphoenolpyruvate carboxykinase (GTP)
MEMGTKTSTDKLPKIFYVNWFRKDSKGKFMWPGFGDNSRVLAWMFSRCANEGTAIETPIGYIPDVTKGSINTEGLNMSPETLKELFKIEPKVWQGEFQRNAEFLSTFGERLPAGVKAQHDRLVARVNAAATE